MLRTVLSFSKQCSPKETALYSQTVHQAQHSCFTYFKREEALLNTSLNLVPWTKWPPAATVTYMHMRTLPSNSVPSENSPLCAVQHIPMISTKYKWVWPGDSLSRHSPDLDKVWMYICKKETNVLSNVKSIYHSGEHNLLLNSWFKILLTAKEIQKTPFP